MPGEVLAPGDPTAWIVYEVGVELDPVVAPAFDAWLPGHIQRILALPGFLRCDVYSHQSVPEGVRLGWQRRLVQYRVRSQHDLEVYLAQHAPAVRAEALERFGEGVHFERRALEHRGGYEHSVPALLRCLDCGATVYGRHCAECGQRTRSRVLTLWALVEEAFESITHADSRLWRTFRALLLKPGHLTSEYLEGRRTRFIPPFRLYLVVSIVYFLLIGLEGLFSGPETDIEDFLVFDGRTVMADPSKVKDPVEREQLIAGLAEAREELRKEGVTLPAMPGETAKPGEAETAPARTNCDDIDLGTIQITPEQKRRLARICRNVQDDGGKRFAQALFNNVPKMMFVFLPLIAAVNMLFYPLKRHYYVAHLLFFVHFHAFVFLAFTIESAYAWIANLIPGAGWTSGLVIFAMVIYIPVYLYKAMRHVFRQGRAWTLWKFALLSQAYVACLVVTFLGLLVYTGMTL